MNVRRLLLSLLLAGAILCAAQSHSANVQPEAVPPEPSWDWIVHYAARRMQAQTLTWSSELQALAQDGNNLTPGQQANLQQGIASAVAALADLHSTLSAPFSSATCPAKFDDALHGADAQLHGLGRDVIPPWTRRSHAAQVQEITTSLDQFSDEICRVENAEPSYPSPPPLSKDYNGVLQGHALAEPGGAPIAGATIRLQWLGFDGRTTPPWAAQMKKDLDDGASVRRQVMSGPDGAWAFTGLPPGCYWLWASSGNRLPISQFVSLPPATPANCALGRNVFIEPAPRPLIAATPDMKLQFAPSGVTTMPYGALVAAYPYDQLELYAADASFSPNGQRLAFWLNSDLWIFNRPKGQLRRVARRTPNGCLNFSSVWLGQDLIINQRNTCNPSQTDYRLDDGRGPLTTIPAVASWPPGGPGEFEHLSPFDHASAVAGDDSLSLERHASRGPFDLYVTQSGGKQRSITPKALSVEGALVDRVRKQVFYDDLGQDAILIYDLTTTKSSRRMLPGQPRALLAATRLAGATLIAYTRDGSCGAHQPGTPDAWGERVCFVEIPDADTR